MQRDRQERKVLRWLGSSLDELRNWPKSVTEEAGTELLSVQEGRDPSNWKAMTTIGAGVREIRISDDGNQYRVIYVAKFVEAIYVVHVFEKKTQKTSMQDLELATKRYRELLISRKKEVK